MRLSPLSTPSAHGSPPSPARISNVREQHSSDSAPRFAAKLDMLLSWSVTPLQFGDHRIFAAVSLIANWKDQALERAVRRAGSANATRRDTPSPSEFLQDQLFDWLDGSDIAAAEENIRDVASLYGELVRRGLFSYDLYVQRLIARVEQGLTVAEVGSVEQRRERSC